MRSNESEFMTLDPAKRIPRALRKWFEALVVLGGLVGGGLGLGFWLGVQQERADRIDEIARLQAAHTQTLDVLTRKTERTAEAVAGAAATVAEVATKADAAAEKADNAATTASTAAVKADNAAATAKTAARSAAVTANTAADVAKTVTATQERDRRAVNNAVDRANARIKERTK